MFICVYYIHICIYIYIYMSKMFATSSRRAGQQRAENTDAANQQVQDQWTDSSSFMPASSTSTSSPSTGGLQLSSTVLSRPPVPMSLKVPSWFLKRPWPDALVASFAMRRSSPLSSCSSSCRSSSVQRKLLLAPEVVLFRSRCCAHRRVLRAWFAILVFSWS